MSGLTLSPYLISNEAVWTPSQLSPLVWYRSDEGITISSGSVIEWADQSGNNNNATNIAGANAPILSGNGNPLGGSCIAFGGGISGSTNTWFTTGTLSQTLSTGAVLCVWQMGSTALQQVLQTTVAGTGSDWELWISSTIIKMWQGATISDPNTTAAHSWVVTISNFEANSSSALYVNSSTAVVTGNAGTNNFGASGFTLGNTANHGDPLHGNICEFIVAPAPLTTTQISDYLTWAQIQWGVT